MTINCKGELVDLRSPKVMGILNITPDSFYDGGKYKNENDILEQVARMLKEGATFIDVGAYSSRPGASPISEQQEVDRILPIIKLLVHEFPDILLSIDTFRGAVAAQCLHEGAAIINDISAGMLDDKMLAIIAQYKVPYIMMHMRGNPENMQQQTSYSDIVSDLLLYFSERVAKARSLGVHDLIIDPGFGFAKTLDQNYEVLKKLNLFQNIDLPILAGLSRKSMIYKTLAIEADEALNGTTALHMIALQQGAKILRAHDVKEALECTKLIQKLM